MAPRASPVPAAVSQPPGKTTLVSQKFGGGFPGGRSVTPSISSNGRYVAFVSGSADLVADDRNSAVDVFVRDRSKGTTIRLPLPGGRPAPAGTLVYDPSISADGGVVAFTFQFTSQSPGFDGPVVTTVVLAWTRKTGKTEVASQFASNTNPLVAGPAPANFSSREPSVSGNGRYVAYTTNAPIDPTDKNGVDDVYRFDLQKGTTVLVSVGFQGGTAFGVSVQPSISDDGTKVAFTSDGGDALLPEDTGRGLQVYLRDIRAKRTERISSAQGGGPANGTAEAPSISADGRYVAFESTAGNLVGFLDGGPWQVYRRDRETGRTALVSQDGSGAPAKEGSGQAAISRDGRMVAFVSGTPNLVVAGPVGAVPSVRLAAVALKISEVYVRDMTAGETALVSVNLSGGAAGAGSMGPVVAGNGRFVAFSSNAQGLVDGDSGRKVNVYIRDFPPVPQLSPSVIDFGAGVVGTATLSGAAVLVNAGWGPLVVSGATISGSAKGDYKVQANGCTKRTLHRSEACTVTIGFSPKESGARIATLKVADSFTGSPRTARLTGQGSLPPPTVTPAPSPVVPPELAVEPGVARPGLVVTAKGSGFPPGAQVRLRWSRGITGNLPVITADAGGAFSHQVLVFHNDLLGKRDLLAESAGGSPFPPVAAPLLVTESPMGPPAFEIMRLLLSLPLVLMIRG